ncbi:MAG: mucoidy inhibitor MuiA family protein, partial [Candidatus Brocadiia bacterium]
MKKLFNITILLLFFVSMKLALGETIEVNGELTSVTVYRGQASVTRSIDTKLPAGTSELVVRGLPNRILPESLYAQTDGDITVLSVRYRERAVERDTRAEVKELDTQIEAVKRQIYHTDRQKGHLNSQWGMFIKLRDFTVEAKNSDLNRGLLTFEPIDKLTQYIQKKGQEYIDSDIKYDDELAQFNKQLELLQRKRADLDAGRSKTEREAVVFVNKTSSGTGTIKLSYIVDGANWFAQYNLRANPDKSAVLIEYNAVVNQTSGENWEGVTLSLSTSEPTMIAAPPVLEHMLLTLRPVAGPAVPGQEFGKRQEQQMANESAPQSQIKAEQYRDISQMFGRNLKEQRIASKKGIAANYEINSIAFDNQFIELSADKDVIQKIQREAERFARTEGVSVSYNLPGKLTLPSRTDQQIVNIASINAKSEFTMVSMPLLTNYIYRQDDI